MSIKINDPTVPEVTDVDGGLLMAVFDPGTGDASYSTVRNTRVADAFYLKVLGGFIEVVGDVDTSSIKTRFLAVLP